jgi:hypothetical protein
MRMRRPVVHSPRATAKRSHQFALRGSFGCMVHNYNSYGVRPR